MNVICRIMAPLLSAGFVASGAAAQDAGPSEPPPVFQAVVDCGRIAEPMPRLACYDAAVKAQAEQVRSVPVERIGASVGVVRGDALAALDEALRLHLAL